MKLFIAAHMITGVIAESRQMLPMAFIVLPMAMVFVQKKLGERTTAEYL